MVYKFPNQKGTAHILVVILFILAVVVGVTLVSKRISFKSQADFVSKIEIIGNYVKDGVTSSQVVAIKPTWTTDQNNVVTGFRLSNDSSKWSTDAELTYTELMNNVSIIWNLAPGDGTKNVYAEFQINGKWQSPPLFASIKLQSNNNPYAVSAKCTQASDSNNTLSINWDRTKLDPGVVSINLSVFDQTGILVTRDVINPLTKTSDLISVNGDNNQYTIYLAAYRLNVSTSGTSLIDPVNSSEATVACERNKNYQGLIGSGAPICGYVKSPSGSPVPGVKVEVRNDKDATPQVAMTDVTGKFSVGGFITQKDSVYSVRVPNQPAVHATTTKWSYQHGEQRDTLATEASYEMQRYQNNDCASAAGDGSGSCRCNFAIPEPWNSTLNLVPATIYFPTNNQTGMEIACSSDGKKIYVKGDPAGQSLRFGKYTYYPHTNSPGNDTRNAKGDDGKNLSIIGWQAETVKEIAVEGDRVSPIGTYYLEKIIPEQNNFTAAYLDFSCPMIAR